MEIGGSGVNGAHAARRAKKESNPEPVNAMPQLQSMEGSHARENQARVMFATRMFLARVSVQYDNCLVIEGDDYDLIKELSR